VFEAPANWRSTTADEDFIKRVIGVRGDHIVCCDDQQRLIINDHPLDEPYIYSTDDGAVDLASEQPFDIMVPKGRFWVMGDHRRTPATRGSVTSGGYVTGARSPKTRDRAGVRRLLARRPGGGFRCRRPSRRSPGPARVDDPPGERSGRHQRG
jgi:hypothetical protein